MDNIEELMKRPYRMELIPDSEEGGYTVYFPELSGCLTCGETLEEVVRNASDAKRAWFNACIEDGVSIPEPAASSYSGQFKLRLPKSLHKQLVLEAQSEGISMNQLCVYKLASR